MVIVCVRSRERDFFPPETSIAYPESSGFLVSGWAPGETLGTKKFKVFDWLLRNGLHYFTAEILR